MLKKMMKILGLALCLSGCTAVPAIPSQPQALSAIPFAELKTPLTLLFSSDLHY